MESPEKYEFVGSVFRDNTQIIQVLIVLYKTLKNCLLSKRRLTVNMSHNS